MTQAFAHADCSSISFLSGTGFGTDFERIRAQSDKIIEDLMNTEIGRRRTDVLYSIGEALRGCSEEGWDGYEALPITEDAYLEASRLVESFPFTLSFPLPEITPEPDGGIGLEWYRGARQLFVASVRGKNEIIYAGLFGASKVHGTEKDFGDSLPSIIIECLKKLYR